MAKLQRMMPEHGGEPLPWPPIVLPGLGHHEAAKRYAEVLEKELAAMLEGSPKWSGSQRQYIRAQRAKWIVRSLGQDPHYERYGSFIRPWGTPPPTFRDVVIEGWRRKAKESGTYVSNQQHKYRWRIGQSDQVKRIVKRLQKRYGTGDKKPQEE